MRAAQHAAAIQQERDAERARLDQDTAEVDMLAQSNEMASFVQNDLGFELDEYGVL